MLKDVMKKIDFSRIDKWKRVVIGMSGGVDSSVAAALLKEAGFDVIGIMLKLWSEPGCEDDNKCCTPASQALARKVAAQIDIPFYVIDAKKEFYHEVVEYFINSYSSCQTPNPCIVCNQHVRWNALYKHAEAFDADYISTGHYSILEPANGNVALRKGVDESKDQTYVLSFLTQELLRKTIFPLGTLNKTEVREIAQELNLPSAKLRDSQDLCFIPTGNYRDFLKKHAPKTSNPGNILTTDGKILGKHKGLAYYTIGQRKGLGISHPQPLFVVEKDISKNTLIITTKDNANKNKATVSDINWITPPERKVFTALVKFRYKSTPIECNIKLNDANNAAEVKCSKSLLDITPGQAAVFYSDNLCLGGGWISSAN